jgi:hypothetical protein
LKEKWVFSEGNWANKLMGEDRIVVDKEAVSGARYAVKAQKQYMSDIMNIVEDCTSKLSAGEDESLSQTTDTTDTRSL